jgi:hypothetical protein
MVKEDLSNNMHEIYVSFEGDRILKEVNQDRNHKTSLPNHVLYDSVGFYHPSFAFVFLLFI